MLIRAGLQAIVNVYDLAALEAALKIKETYGAEVHVFTMGPQKAESVLREAFAMGADEGFLICDKAFAGADVLATSYTPVSYTHLTGRIYCFRWPLRLWQDYTASHDCRA